MCKKRHPEQTDPGTTLHLQGDLVLRSAETNEAAQRAKETTQPQEPTKQQLAGQGS